MLKIREYKEPQHNLSTEKFFSPKKLYLPLSQHTGKPPSLCVKEREVVEEVQLIAKKDALISSNLHSPKKGIISKITNFNHPILKKARTVILECQEEEKKAYKTRSVEDFSKEKLLNIIEEKGIVGMGGAAFPTYVKLNPPKKVDTLIINGCECEPYLACDYRLMVENIEEIFKGIEIICKIIEPKEVFFAVEDNKEEAIKKINLCLSLKKFNLPKAKLVILKTSYPQGGEKQLIYSITKRKVPPKGLPFDVGCLVQNVATCFAIYEAVYLDKPLIERVVSFCGDALKEPKNLWIKIGTTLSELFQQNILQFKKEPKKIICGGPMMGTALDGLDYPILKATGGFLFLSQDVELEEETPCLRCARCVDACPMQLLPLEFVRRVKIEDFDSLEDFNIVDCIECGSCSYVCPAKIPLVHYIKVGKKYASSNK
jgi:electron transport complex protein RnfC